MVSVFLFAFAISMDAFSLAIGFGIKGLKFKFLDCIFINVINSFFLFISILLSRSVFSFLDVNNISTIGCCFLFLLGVFNLINYFLSKTQKEIYFNKKQKTVDKLSITVLLCVESVVSGFSMLAFDGSIITLVFLSFVLHTMFLFLGLKWGKNVAKGTNLNTEWLSGVIFILLAISKIFG